MLKNVAYCIWNNELCTAGETEGPGPHFFVEKNTIMLKNVTYYEVMEVIYIKIVYSKTELYDPAGGHKTSERRCYNIVLLIFRHRNNSTQSVCRHVPVGENVNKKKTTCTHEPDL